MSAQYSDASKPVSLLIEVTAAYLNMLVPGEKKA